MSNLNFVIGDATHPRATKTIIAQGNNNIGAWGAGFVLAVDKLSLLPRQEYLDWANNGYFYHRDDAYIPDNTITNKTPKRRYTNFELGEIQLVKVGDDVYVANMITQKGCGLLDNYLIPFRADSTRECFYRLSKACKKLGIMHVTMPRIGCGLAGGDWATVEVLVKEELVARGIDVDVYDLPVRQPVGVGKILC